jgi:hypothetical protein
MGLFRRSKREDDETAEPVDTTDGVAPADAQDDADAAVSSPTGRPQGPWDEADAPDDDTQRVDLGGLRVPVPPQTEVRVEVSKEGQVVAATLVRGPSAMQVSAFAAPRTGGIWDEVREEIATALRESGGRAEEAEGPFGVELAAGVPTEVPGQGRTLTPTRFLGVDGPRWFLRALLSGPAVTDPQAAAPLEQALRSVVVVRGSEAMAVRDPLVLRLPKDAAAAATAAQAEQQPAQPAAGQPAERGAPQMPERGPEITEVR